MDGSGIVQNTITVLALAAILGGSAATGALASSAPEPDNEACVEDPATKQACDQNGPSLQERLGQLIELIQGLVAVNQTSNNVWHPQAADSFDGMLPQSSSPALLGGQVRSEAVMDSADSVGLTAGGAQDVGNFRANIENGYLPLATDITPEGLFSEYYFDTGQTEPCDSLFCPTYARAVTPDPLSGKYEAWLSVGLNSGLTVEDFERPDLNLVVVLDVSGSMSSPLDKYHYDGAGRPDFGSMTKMEAANRAVAGLTDRLGPDDRLGIVLFDDQPHVARPLLSMEGVDRHQLKTNIMGIFPAGGTYMEGGMRAGTNLFGGGDFWGMLPKPACGSTGEWCADSYDQIKCHCPERHGCVGAGWWCLDSPDHLSCVCTDPQGCPDAIHWCIRPGPNHPDNASLPDDGRANRIIFLTDAMPNIGDTSERGLLGMLKKNAADGIHTTFIGMGVDFNTELVEAITKVRGANYYSVHSADGFNQRMVEEFEFMVTPLVFDLELTLESDSWEIAKVYGSPEADESTGTLMKVNTLFPSSRVDGETRGGLVLLRLDGCIAPDQHMRLTEGRAADKLCLQAAKTDSAHDKCLVDSVTEGCFGPLNLTATYETVDGVAHSTNATVRVLDKEHPLFVTLQDGTAKPPLPQDKDAVYDNDGIRKGVLLARYAELMQSWITFQRAQAGGIHPDGPLGDGLWPQPSWPPLGHWERTSLELGVSPPYDSMISWFLRHFMEEAAELGDPALDGEIAILLALSASRGG